jgi:hypothetical protein
MQGTAPYDTGRGGTQYVVGVAASSLTKRVHLATWAVTSTHLISQVCSSVKPFPSICTVFTCPGVLILLTSFVRYKIIIMCVCVCVCVCVFVCPCVAV